MIAELRTAGYAGWTIRGILVALSRILGTATRRGLIPANPVRKLERSERPSVTRREMRCLSREEIGKLLAAALPTYRSILATAIFTGLRLSELLALTWADVDFAAGVVRVRKQLARNGERVDPKTAAAVRDVVLMPALAKVLRAHKGALGVLAGASLRLLDGARRAAALAQHRATRDGRRGEGGGARHG
jgi:integrase